MNTRWFYRRSQSFRTKKTKRSASKKFYSSQKKRGFSNKKNKNNVLNSSSRSAWGKRLSCFTCIFRLGFFGSPKKDPLESRLGYFFRDKDIKIQALTHRSWAGERRPGFHNERLEFLGDAVFDLSVSDLLMEAYPEADEGELSKMRASLVNTQDLADLALSLQLDKEILLSTGAKRERGQLNPRILACVLEALVGAIYMDGGYKKAKKAIKQLLGSVIKRGPVNRDYKSLLQELVQKRYRKVPTYSTIQVTGPQHEKNFIVEVKVGKETWGKGEGLAKKQAEQSAALFALRKRGMRIS